MSLRILARSPEYLVISKPAGLAFHQEGEEAGVMQILRQMETEGKLPAGERLFPVHRLDTITSGILVIARGRKSANQIGNEFRFGRVEKVYCAISEKAPTRVMGTISGDMEKAREGNWQLTRSQKDPAVTHFISVPYKTDRAMRLFLLRPATGKTHQIRVALKSTGSPILGDGRYGGYGRAREEERGYLHAYAIRFRSNGKTVQVIDYPTEGREFRREGFLMALKQAGDPFSIRWPGLRSAGKRPFDPYEKPRKAKKKRPPKRRGSEA